MGQVRLPAGGAARTRQSPVFNPCAGFYNWQNTPDCPLPDEAACPPRGELVNGATAFP